MLLVVYLDFDLFFTLSTYFSSLAELFTDVTVIVGILGMATVASTHE
jgi:hypothetical protein